jgi:exodeoxyribonuclease VII small subunit
MNSDPVGRGASGRQRAAHPERNGAARPGGHGAPPDVPSYDAAFAQLEATVAALENGELDLNEAVDVFERGMRLAQRCQEILDQAELRVGQLVTSEDEPDTLSVEMLEFEDD